MRSRIKLKFLGIIIPFLLISLMSQNTFAANLSQINFLKRSQSYDGVNWSEVVILNSPSYFPVRLVTTSSPASYNYYSIRYLVGQFSMPAVSGKYFNASVSLEFSANPGTFTRANCLGLDGYIQPENLSIQNEVDLAECEVSSNGSLLYTTIITRGNFANTSSVSSLVFLTSNYSNSLFSCMNAGAYSAPLCQNQGVFVNSINYQFRIEEDPLVAGQNTLIEQNQEMIDKENAAIENIDNQSASDIQGAENQATTNLVGVLSNFFTQLQGFQATNCNLDLPFPQFIGGTQTVNICQGKDVLGNFITVIGTLAMVGFYIPLAWVLLKMIYNEIRSFTNG